MVFTCANFVYWNLKPQTLKKLRLHNLSLRFQLVEKFNENIKSTNAEYADNNSRLVQSPSMDNEKLVNVESDTSEDIYIGKLYNTTCIIG